MPDPTATDEQQPTPQAAPEAAAEPTAAPQRWYRVFCWPTPDKAGKPVTYVSRCDTAGAAVDKARGKIAERHGAEQAEGWTLTVQRTTEPKDAGDGGDG